MGSFGAGKRWLLLLPCLQVMGSEELGTVSYRVKSGAPAQDPPPRILVCWDRGCLHLSGGPGLSELSLGSLGLWGTHQSRRQGKVRLDLPLLAGRQWQEEEARGGCRLPFTTP
jgi:hypothetical protein